MVRLRTSDCWQKRELKCHQGLKLGHRYLVAIDETVRGAIRNDHLAMVDITDGLSALSAQTRAYIDAEHYSPPANEEIARIYRTRIGD